LGFDLDKYTPYCYGVYMERYQIYLNPVSVDFIDEEAEQKGISRSKIIQELVNKRALSYSKKVKARPCKQHKSAILKMAGMLKGAYSKSLVDDIDEVLYMRD